MYPSSVVQTGVKSLGCENRTAHESPIQSWKAILPWVVFASKSGAVLPIDRVTVILLVSGWGAFRHAYSFDESSASPCETHALRSSKAQKGALSASSRDNTWSAVA